MVLKIAAFVAVWSLYFIVTEHASAIHNDMAEAYAWGREFELGYNQHPPFWAWVCGVWFLVFPRANWAFAILSMLNSGIGLAGVFALVGRFVDGERRFAATALMALTPFYSFLAYKYNANSIFLSLWPWMLHFFMRALRERGLGPTLGLGVVTGLALESKYFALIFVATCLMAALASGERRAYFRSFSPYVSAALAALIWAPHLAWLAESGAPPIRYLARVSGRTLAETVDFAALAVIGALLQQAVALGLVAAAARTRPARLDLSLREPEAFRLLLILALAPTALSVLAALLLRTKLSSNMLMAVFPLSPLLAIAIWRPEPARLWRWTLRAAMAVSLGALLLSPVIAVAKAWYGRDSEDWEPRQEAATAATAFWRQTTAAPLAFVAGSFRYENAAAFYSAERPSVFVNFDYFGNRWVTPEKLGAQGLLTICRKDARACLDQTAVLATAATRREDVTLAHAAYGRSRKSVDFVLTAIPPK
jgi:4-amino-4-deoxy-L-arabinose transferase-like glycosyltransferase